MVILILEMAGDLAAFDIAPRMKPGARQHWRYERGAIPVSVLPRGCPHNDCADLFGVPLLNHAETTEFALDTVEVAVVVPVAGVEAVTANPVVRFHTFHDMNWER